MIYESGKDHLWEERTGNTIDTIVIHYISAIEIHPDKPFDFNQIITIFCMYGVSSHYIISRRGKITLLVPEEKKAWHCGHSIMPAPDLRRSVNEFSIGIELMATDNSGYTTSQYSTLTEICSAIERRYERQFSYVGHDMIAGEDAVRRGLRKVPKTDPGQFFDWTFFLTTLECARNKG